MKKVSLVFVIAFLALAIIFTACKRDKLIDEDPDNEEVVAGSWEYLGSESFTAGNPGAKNAEIKLKNGVLYIAYAEIGSPDVDIYYYHVQKFENGQWTFLTDKELVGYSGMNMDPSIEIDDNANVYISFSASVDNPNPNQTYSTPLTVFKYDGNSWTQLGGILAAETHGSDLAISPNGDLFCTYASAHFEGNMWDEVDLYTKKWNGTAWEDFGIKTDQTDDFAETIADNDNVYNLTKKNGAIALYSNAGNNWYWAAADIPNGGDIYSMQKNILFDNEQNIYVTAQFVLGTGEGRENAVYKLKKGERNWEQIGDAVRYSVNYVSLAISPDNELYMGYIEIDPLAYVFHENHDQYDEATSVDSKFTVGKFDGENWIVIGQQGFASRGIVQPKIVADNDKVYAMFREHDTKQYSVMVFKF